jgi:hypothetical protein
MGDKKEQKADPWFEKIQKYVTAKIGAFVAFIFLIFAAGAFAAIMVMQRWPGHEWLVIMIPAVAGIIAYYNRTFAIIAFVLLLALVFI